MRHRVPQEPLRSPNRISSTIGSNPDGPCILIAADKVFVKYYPLSEILNHGCLMDFPFLFLCLVFSDLSACILLTSRTKITKPPFLSSLFSNLPIRDPTIQSAQRTEEGDKKRETVEEWLDGKREGRTTGANSISPPLFPSLSLYADVI